MFGNAGWASHVIPGEEASESDTQIQFRILRLSPGFGDIEAAWYECVVSGHLEDSTLIYTRHMAGTVPELLSHALSAISPLIEIDRVVKWLETGLHGVLSRAVCESEQARVTATAIIAELCKRARYEVLTSDAMTRNWNLLLALVFYVPFFVGCCAI